MFLSLICILFVFYQPIFGFNVGVGGRSILPLVNGSTSYFVELSDEDATSAGTFVLEFDDGVIPVGNGDASAHWVRHDIRVHVAAIEQEDEPKTIAVFVSVEVYMIFEPDFQEYYDLVEQEVGPETFSRLRFFCHGQHNHEGPDTSGLTGSLNRKYQEYMYNEMKEATIDAIRNLRPAELSFGQFKHYFGLEDTRDPIIIDENVHVLRAVDTSTGKRIFTIVQWAMHPEVTLGYRATPNPGDCERLGNAPDCTARGQFLSSDFPGVLYKVLQKLDGSEEVIYFNGAIGTQVGPGGHVWEITPEHPLGDGINPPPGAEPLPYSFRKAYLIGEQLAVQIANLETRFSIPKNEPIEFRSTRIFSRISNPFFRVGLVPRSAFFGNDEIPLKIGYNLRPLYICPEGNPSEEECVSDNYEYTYTPIPVRKGNYGRIEIRYIRIGPLKLISIPGELAPEISVGVPQDFDNGNIEDYFRHPELHPTGKDYTFPGTIHSMLNCTEESPCFVCGLTGDQLGYMFPICDWRINCVDVNTPESCLDAYEKGALDYKDSMSGESCDLIFNDFDAAREYYSEKFSEEIAELVIQTCKLGPMSYEDGEHYEETNSAGWNAVADYLGGLSRLLNVPVHGRYKTE